MQAALTCIDECEELKTGYPEDVQYALNLYWTLSSQVIVAGMDGQVLGLNHLAVHTHFSVVEQMSPGAYYRYIFNLVNVFDGMFRNEQRKNNPQAKSGKSSGKMIGRGKNK